eukprot:scaffold8736_cov114-Isochrysis_galbana.AAC.4
MAVEVDLQLQSQTFALQMVAVGAEEAESVPRARVARMVQVCDKRCEERPVELVVIGARLGLVEKIDQGHELPGVVLHDPRVIRAPQPRHQSSDGAEQL